MSTSKQGEVATVETAEVSVCYLHVVRHGALIRWIETLGDIGELGAGGGPGAILLDRQEACGAATAKI